MVLLRARSGLFGLAVTLLIAGCADGGEAQRGAIQVRLVTPIPATATPTRVPEPTATATPVEEPELVLSVTEVFQGGALLVSITGGVEAGTAEFLGRSYGLIQGAQSKYTLLGVGVADPTGVYPLNVTLALPDGSTATFARDITVLPTEWTVDYIEFTPSEGDLILDPQARADEKALLAETLALETLEKLWGGAWLQPVAGVLSGRFGEQRSFNGGPVGGHHGGTDYAADEGTPVIASSGGRVVVARQLAVRGNMVIIDHGGGVLSGYAHLSTFAVAEGQLVDAGQLIAFVGSTGLSTGAHLHWEMSVHGILVDALRFIDGSNGF